MAKTTTNDTHNHTQDHSDHSHGAPAARHPEIGENKQIEFTVPWAQVEQAYQSVIRKYQPHVKTDGFRKGHAPLKIVEQMVGPERLLQETAEKVVPAAYVEAVKKAEAKPISDPEIHPTSMDMGKDWAFHAHIAEKPTVTLGKYQDVVKKALKKFDEDQKKEKTPKENKSDAKKDKAPAEKAPEPSEEEIKDQKLNVILSALRDSTKPVIAELLIKQEAQRQLEQLEQQLKSYNIEVQSYIKSMGKTVDEVQQEYTGRALATWQMEVILDAVAEDQKIDPEEKELDQIIAAAGNESEPTATQRAQMKSMLRKQKVFEHLLEIK